MLGDLARRESEARKAQTRAAWRRGNFAVQKKIADEKRRAEQPPAGLVGKDVQPALIGRKGLTTIP